MKEKEEELEQKEEKVVTPTMKLVGRIRPQRGHSLFKYTTATGKFIKVEALDSTTDTDKPKRINVLAEKGNVYVSALNFKNAVKKIAQLHGIQVDLKNL